MPSHSLRQSARTICYTLNDSTTYKLSNCLKTLLYVKELTGYEAMNVECSLNSKNQLWLLSCDPPF